MTNDPTLSLDVPGPAVRPGGAPDFSGGPAPKSEELLDGLCPMMILRAFDARMLMARWQGKTGDFSAALLPAGADGLPRSRERSIFACRRASSGCERMLRSHRFLLRLLTIRRRRPAR